MKSVLKEILIMILVCVAIVLVMAVIFYNYIPSNKVVPSKVSAYSTPENVEAEISESVTNTFSMEDENYTIENSDLSAYQANASYNPGKADPFAAYSEETTTSTTTSENTTTTTSTTTTDANVTDNYYTSQNVGSSTK